MSKTTEERIDLAMVEMQAEGVKINPNTVAKRVGISRATIATRYPKLKIKIDSLKHKQESAKEAASDKELIAKQASEIEKLAGQLADTNNDENSIEEFEKVMHAKLFEAYRLYDEAIAENRDLRSRIIHHADEAVDKETGEFLPQPSKKV